MNRQTSANAFGQSRSPISVSGNQRLPWQFEVLLLKAKYTVLAVDFTFYYNTLTSICSVVANEFDAAASSYALAIFH